MKNGRTFRQFLALLLCFAMILPNFTGLVSAASTGDSSASSQSTETATSPWVPATPTYGTDIPTYATTSGVASQMLECDGGNGIYQNDSKSYMVVISGTTYQEFDNYRTNLTNNGFISQGDVKYIKDNENSDGSGGTWRVRWARFKSPSTQDKYILTVYHIRELGETRIVVDTAEDIYNSFAAGFSYNSETGESGKQVSMVMYGLSMSKNGFDQMTDYWQYNTTGQRNCGALIVIRMPDNSLFINDGGDIQQWSDEACANFMQFCRELTGQTKANGRGNERVVINTWFVSHAHSDHYAGFPRFIEQYHDQIDIKNVMYNIDDERLGSTRDISAVMKMVHSFFPEAKYYKPHTGETFYIEGIKFEVLWTHEDRFLTDAQKGTGTSNTLSIDSSDVGGTYRDDCFYYTEYDEWDSTTNQAVSTNGKELQDKSDFNDTTTVLKLTFPEDVTGGDEVTSILYGDVNRVDQTIIKMYEDLAADIMMIPHHGHDPHRELVTASNAAIFLHTQNKTAIYGLNGVVDSGVEYGNVFRGKLVRYYEVTTRDIASKLEAGTSKIYWEGTETAAILFGDNKTFTDGTPTGLEKDAESPSGYSVYTMDAPNFAYEGWTILSTVVGTNDFAVSDVPTETKSTGAYGVEVNPSKTNATHPEYHTLSSGDVYAIVHDKSDLLMTYTALTNTYNSTPGLATSVEVGTRTEAQNDTKNVYYAVSNGQSNDGSLFFSHDLRDAALWKFSLRKYDDTADLTYGYTSTSLARVPQFGGSTVTYFYQSRFLKGTSDDAVYWNTAAADFNNTWLQLQPNYQGLFRLGNYSNISTNIRIEFFENDGTTDTDGDGIAEICDTCVIYYSARGGKADGYPHSDFRFLTVDPETGVWYQKTYETKAEAEADLDNLKLRLYRYRNVSAKKTVGCKGPQDYTVLKGTESETLINSIAYQLTVEDNYRNGIDIECSGTTPKVGYYWIDTSANLNAVGDYTASIKYRNDDGSDTEICTVNIHVVEQLEMGYELDPEDCNGIAVSKSALADNVFSGYDEDGSIIDRVLNQVVNTSSGYDIIDSDVSVTVGMLTCNINTKVYNADGTLNEELTNACAAGAYINTDVSDGTRYENLTLTYDGVILTDSFTLTIEAIDSVDYPTYPKEGSVQVNKTGTAEGINFKNSGIAQIQLSATGIPMDKGVDLIVVVDLSSSMEYGVDTVVDALDGERRLDKLLSSLNEVIEELQESGADVRIAMSDFGDLDSYAFEKSVLDTSVYHEYYFDSNTNRDFNGTYELYNHLNYVIKTGDHKTSPYGIVNSKFNTTNPSYMGVITPNVYTGTGKANADAFVDVGSLNMTAIAEAMKVNVEKSIGTNYDIGLEYAYQMGYARQQQNIVEGDDRDIVCIFMSDGAAMQYNYFSGTTGAEKYPDDASGWGDWLQGSIDSFTTSVDYVTLLEKVKNGEDVSDTKVEIVDQIADVLLTRMKSGILVNPDYDRGNKGQPQYFTYHSSLTPASDFFYTHLEAYGYRIDWEFLYAIADMNKGTGTVKDILGADTEAAYVALDKESKKHAQLLNLLQNGSSTGCTNENHTNCNVVTSGLLNPYYSTSYHYFAQSTTPGVFQYTSTKTAFEPTSTNFFGAFKELTGVDCSWNLFWEIAVANAARSNNVGGVDSTTINQARAELLTALHSLSEGTTYGTLSPYSYFYNAEGKNWWAEAIKGDTTMLYPVINKYAKDSALSPYAYNGDVENYFSGSTTAGLQLDRQDYISGFKGLGMDLYAISFSIASENQLSSEIAETVLRNIATGPSYFYSANDEASLTNALKSIVSTMSRGATQGYFVDTMGVDYDLFTGFTDDMDHTDAQQANVSSGIRVLEYTLDASGNRVGEPIELEAVTFDVSSTVDPKAYSTQKFTTSTNDAGGIVTTYTDIWDADGIIRGKYFYYNTTTEPIKIDLTGDGVGDYTLNGESFFWILGQIGQTELVLEYEVYLTGTFDDADRLAGVYDTNKEATLYYVNYLGNNCHQDTISPSFPWDQGRVGVAFYLVDSTGKPLVDQSSLTTGTFENAIKLTRPVYEVLQMNEDGTLSSKDVAAVSFLPPGYTLYNPNASYTVTINSNGDGSWTISDTGMTQKTTYVESVAGYKQTDESYTETYTTADTVVWFAVYVDKALTVADTVVVDYGLPVDIHVMANDILFEDNGKLVGVGAHRTDPTGTNAVDTTTNLATGFGTSYTVSAYGKASVVDNVVRYELTQMGMHEAEKFSYAVQFTGTSAVGVQGYYYETVTVIPATTIYYEDSFLKYSSYEINADVSGADREDRENSWTEITNSALDCHWDTVGSTIEGAYQSEDRPGSFNHSDIDKDNIYGYDPVYKTSSTYSLGSAMKVTVGSDNGPNNRETTAEAEFTFWGTGFDVISMTSSDTGVIVVQVFAVDGAGNETLTRTLNVDTYYGYKFEDTDEDGKLEWTVSSDGDALYQVPVIKAEGLDYGQYTVKIDVVYSKYFDHKADSGTTKNKYDFYLDAIRIYDPAGSAWDGTDNTNPSLNDDEIIDAYNKDGEFAPTYQELRNLLLKADSLGTWKEDNTPYNGAVFIDGIQTLTDGTQVEGMDRNPEIGTYMNYGPNNEVYLAPGQGVAFKLTNSADLSAFHIAMKKAGKDGNMTGDTVVKVFAVEDHTRATASATTISTATDMYFDFTSLKGKTIVIYNAGSSTDGILSITNLKMVTSTTSANNVMISMSSDEWENVFNALVIDKAEDHFILAGANTVLGGELDMNFFIDPADLNGTDYYAQITLHAEDGTTTTTIPYADWEVRDDYLVVTQKGLAARQMADKIEVVIYKADGTQASDVWTDSIRDYAIRILESQNDECKTLIVDMLNYGAAAQTVFGYNTDDLANNQLTDAQKAYATETVSCNDQRVQGEGYYGSTLTLKDRIMLSVYFSNITPDMYAMVSFTDHKGNAHETRVDGSAFAKYNSSVYGVVVDELVVADGDQLVTVTVYDAEGNVVASASDTVNSYVARQMGSDPIYEMVGKFTTSAYAYFH